MDGELTACFPQKFNETEELEFYYTIQKQLDADLEALIDENKLPAAQEARQAAIEYMASVTKPRSFTGASNFMVLQEGSFEALCCIMEDNGAVNAKALSTFEFFHRSEYCEKKYKAQNT